MCSLCRLPVAKTTILGKFLHLGDFCTDPFLLMRAKFSALEQTYTLTCEISSRSIYSVALWRWKSPIFAVFWTSACSVSPTGNSLTKLNTGAQLQAFPYPTVSKSFLYSNAFMAKSGAQTLTFKSVTNKQTDKQTNRQKSQRFCSTGGGWNPSPTKL